MRIRGDLACLVVGLMLGAGCGGVATGTAESPEVPLRGTIAFDGAPDVSAVAESAAEQFLQYEPDVAIRLDRSGERSAVRRLCDGDVDVVYATRLPTPGERSRCDHDVVAVRIATEALAVVAHPEASWARCLSPRQLGRLASAFAPRTWADIVDGAPRVAPRVVGGAYARLYPSVAGRVGLERASLSLLDPSQVITDVRSDPGAVGFIGAGWAEEASDTVRLVAIRESARCVLPSRDAVRAGRYRALTRPIYLLFVADSGDGATRALLRFTVEEHEAVTRGAQLIDIGEDHLRRSEQLVG